MVDVGNKDVTHRIAKACGMIRMLPETLSLILAGNHRKGDVIGIARVAAIMATKRTSELIPLCHPLALTKVSVNFKTDQIESTVSCEAQVETFGKTGVEIEALMAVQVGLLTIYDMCKAVDKGMTINEVKLIEKSGGQSGTWNATDQI